MENKLSVAVPSPSAVAQTRLRQERRTQIVRRIEPYLYLIPALLVVGIWIYRPLVQVIELSFYQWNLLPTSPRTWVGLENYARLLALPEMGIALRNTLWYVFGILPLSIIVPLIIALTTDQIGGRWRNTYRVLIFTPMVMAPVVVAVIWSWILDPTLGVVNALIKGVFDVPAVRFFTDRNVAIWSIIFITGWKLTGFSTLIFSAAMTNINREYIEAASIDGATRRQIVWRIILPLLSPTILFMTMLSVLFASQWSFTYINVLTTGGPVNSTTNIYYLLWDFGFRTFSVGWSSAAAVLLLIGFGAVAFIFQRLSARFAFYDN